MANADLIRQAGTRKAGFELRQKASEHVQLSYRFDRQKSTDPDNVAGVFVTSPEEARFHTAQMKADYDRYLGVLEYRNQDIGTYGPALVGLKAALDEVQFKNAAALKLGYRVYPDLMPYGKVQTSFGGNGGPNHQFGGGVEAKVLKGKGTVFVEELAGTLGDSTRLGFDVQTTETTNVYSIMKTGPDSDGHGSSTSAGILSTTDSKVSSDFAFTAS